MCQARMVQLEANPGQGKELAKKVTQGVLPLLKKQQGFVEAITLTSQTEPDQFLGVWIWKTQKDADVWTNGKGRETVQAAVGSLLRRPPEIRTFTVDHCNS